MILFTAAALCRGPFEADCPGSSVHRPFATHLVMPSIALAMTLSHVARANDPTCCCTAHLSPSCTDTSCSATVCAFDPYCCSTQWDSICASHAAQTCGSTAPYCVDINQSGTPDVCESGGGGGGDPADCDGDGTADLNETGPQGKVDWVGATSGTGIKFETDASWSLGRPGTASLTEISIPYSQWYDSLQLQMECDNAVRTMHVLDGGTSILHDFELNLGSRTLRFASPSAATLRFTPQTYDSFRPTLHSGTVLATDSGLTLIDQGSLQVAFADIDLVGGAFAWTATVASEPPTLILSDSSMDISGFTWPPTIQGFAVSPTLEMVGALIELQSPSGAPTAFEVPDTGVLRTTSPSASTFGKISGPGLMMSARAGSLIDLDGRLVVEGSLGLGGSLIGRSHCNPLAQYCYPSVLTAQALTYPATQTASWNWGIDLSGGSGSTPDGLASVRVSGTASIDGTLLISDLSNGLPPTLGFSVPLVWSPSFASGHDNFDLVRVYGMDQTELPAGYFVTTERVGDTIHAIVKRGVPIASTAPVNDPLPTAPTLMEVIDDGSVFGLPLVAYATSGSGGGTVIDLRKIDSATGSVIPQGTIYAPGDLTDLVSADLDADGLDELVASFGASGQIRAWRVGGYPTLLWTASLPQGTRAECLCEIPPPSQTLLPVGSSIGFGSSTGSKGGFGTIGSGGALGGSQEIAIVPRTLDGTDIDNDDDTDIVAGGESSADALTGSTPGAVMVIVRGPTGGYSQKPSVALPGIPNALAVADLDGDGLKDVVASCDQIAGSFPAGNRPTGVVLRGAPLNGAGSTQALLRAPAALDVGSGLAQGSGVSLVDADADGNLDIALSWQDTGFPTSGGAVVFPIREQRPAGGLSIGGKLRFGLTAVSQMQQLGASSVLSVQAVVTSLNGQTSLVQDDFAAAPVLGDLDDDGFVTTADVALLLLDFGLCPGSPCPADLDGTGEVDTGDLAFILLLFN